MSYNVWLPNKNHKTSDFICADAALRQDVRQERIWVTPYFLSKLLLLESTINVNYIDFDMQPQGTAH